MFQDILRESYVYQTILREGLEEGLEQGREQTLRTYVETRFPQLVLLAGFGAVMPKSRPEDLQAMREHFEESIAGDGVSES